MAVKRPHIRLGTRILMVVLLCLLPVITRTLTAHPVVVVPSVQLTDAEKNWLAQTPTIRMGVPDGVPGLSHVNEKGQVQGFLIDYLQLIEQRSGLKFELVVKQYTEFLDKDSQNQVDVILSSRGRVAGQPYLYTKSFYRIPLVIITRNDATAVTGKQWLAGKRVAALKGFSLEQELRDDPIGIQVVPVASVEEGVHAVSFGQVDAFVNGLLLASRVIAEQQIQNLKVAGSSGYPDIQGCLRIRQDWPQLQSILNKAIESIPPSEHKQLMSRWMLASVPAHVDWPMFWRWGGTIGGVLLLLLLASAFWNRQLKRQVALRTHELEQAAHTLQESEERYRSTFEYAAVGMAHTSLDGLVLRANQRLCEMLGYHMQAFLGLHYRDITHPDDLGISQDYYQRLLRGECDVCHADKRYYRKDRSIAWCHLSTTVHRNDQGQPLYFINVIEDITQAHMAKEQLRESNSRLQSVMDASILSMIVATDKDGLITLFNAGAQRMLGFTAQQVIGKHTPMLFHLKSEIQQRRKVLEEKRGHPVKDFDVFIDQADIQNTRDNQWRLVTKAGQQIQIKLAVTSIRNSHGEVSGYLGVGQDITELLKAKEELVQKEENLRTTLNSIGDAVIATDSDGRIMQMNPVAEKLTGRGLDQAMGRNLTDVFHIINAKTRQTMPNPVDKVLQSGEIVGLANHTILISADSSEYQIADSGAPIRDDKNQIIGVVLVFRDVTSEYAMEHRLRETEKMNAIGQLAGGIAHDFNNMLGGILGSAELLEERLPDHKETHELFQIMVQSAQRAADLTSKLLAFSRKQPPQTSTLDVHQLLKDTVNILKQTIDRRIEIQSDFAAEHQLIQGDLAQLQNVFMNLGINASHAMPDGGKIIISTQAIELTPHIGPSNPFNLKAGPYIRIDVQDTGVGIDPEHLSHIFEPFFTTKDQGKGTGLGLATVFSTIKQHLGSITATSDLGRGTCFTVCLPLSTLNQPAPSEDAPQQRVAGKGHILIVDDEKVMRITAKAILEDLGYEVSLAHDGQMALDMFRENPITYDLVVLDMMMPNLNGRDCFMAMKQIRPDIKVILSTGYTPESELLAMQAAGLTAWIKKPYMSGPLSQKIQEVLEQ
ncbi:MAG: PAS domain S-box protein [Phycisphaeraceae bacterium JB051]